MSNFDIKNKLEDINTAIISSYDLKTNGYSLMVGDAGLLLFSAYYYKHFKDERSLTFCLNLVDNIISKIENGDIENIGFCEGLSGCLWAIKHLHNENLIDLELDDFTEDIDEYLFQSAISVLQNKQNHDFFYGSFGVFLYFLEDAVKHKHKLETLLEETYKVVEQDEKYAYWVQKIDKETNVPLFNLGMAHGYPSYIMLLVLCKQYDIGEALKRQSMMEKTIDFLLSFKREEGSPLFPASVSKKGVVDFGNTIIWSYGDLSRAIAIIYAGLNFNNESWHKTGLEIAKKSINNLGISQGTYSLAGICRGTSGIAMLCQEIYTLTKYNTALEANTKWVLETLNNAKHENGLAGYKDYDNVFQNAWIDSYDLLDGVSGIGLVLLSQISGNWQWNRCFLMK
jgi:lantibiotic biosynthesis protein